MDEQNPNPSAPNAPQAPKQSNKFMSAMIGIVVAIIAGAYIMMQKKQPLPETQNTNDQTGVSPTSAMPAGEEFEDIEEREVFEDDGTVPPTSDTPEPAANTPTAPTSSGEGEATTETVSTYKDGTYAAVGNYITPGGPEKVGVTVTLQDGVITDSSIDMQAIRPISKEKQEIFSQNFKAQVIGKNIEDVQLDKVSTSSLTPKGFNDALAQIMAEAKM